MTSLFRWSGPRTVTASAGPTQPPEGVSAGGLYRLRAPGRPRRSLRPHLNQIRGWVRQGRTDAWIAHQLEVTVQQIEAFKRENDLVAGDDLVDGPTGADFDDEIDLRAEDDALIAAELEAAEAAKAEEEARRAEEEERRREEDERRREEDERRRAEAAAEGDSEADGEEEDEDEDEAPR